MDGLQVEVYREPPPPPSQPGLELLIEDLGTLVLSLPRTPPPQEFELLMEDCAGAGIPSRYC